MRATIENIRRTFGLMAWSWRFIRDWRARFIVCSAFSVLQNAWMSITSAYLIGQTTAHAAAGDFQAMLGTIGLVAAIAALGIAVVTVTNYHTAKISLLGLAQLRKALFAKLNAMPVADARGYLSGDLSTRMSVDAEQAAAFFGPMMTGDRSIFAIPVSILLSSVICIAVLPVVGLLNLLFLLLSIYANLLCTRREYTAHARRMGVFSLLTQQMTDLIAGRVTVRMFGLSAQRQGAYRRDSQTAYTHAMRGGRYNALRASLSSAIQWGAIIFSLLAGSALVHRGATDLGTVVFIVLMQSQINNDVLLMTNSYHRLQYATVAAGRVKEILNYPDEPIRPNRANPAPGAPAAVELRHVTVSYGPGDPVLRDVSLTVRNGERLAIVGGSGGGKTTLIRCILEFVEPDSGSVRLYGQPLERYAQPMIRDLTAYVPQSCYLFDGTIRENIAWGNPQATEAMVCRAAQDAGLLECIGGMPDGMDTCVGERGARLSGGQRQRIGIARALIKAAPLLLLDEATSALDGEAEQGIEQALRRLPAGRTAIIIAHRLSTIQHADRILVIEHGEIIEEGRHRELLAKGGRYAELYRLQYR